MEARIAKLEAHVEHIESDIAEIKSDIRILRDAIQNAKIWAVLLYVGLAGGLLYAMAKGFKWLS